MSRDALYAAIFGVLCVLAGVLVGANIAKQPSLPWHGPQRPNFAERSEHLMGGQRPRGPAGMKSSSGFIEILTTQLSLNADQKTKVMEILEKTRQEIEAVGRNVRSSITQIREKGDSQIMNILTPAQQEKFKALLKGVKIGCEPKGQTEGHRPTEGHEPRPNEDFPLQK